MMETSFKRAIKSSLNHHFEHKFSSGVGSLDTQIGGLLTGSLVSIEEDEYGQFSQLLLKCMLADSIYSGHRIIYSDDMKKYSNPDKIIKSLPRRNDIEFDEIKVKHQDDMKIAWRYTNSSRREINEKYVFSSYLTMEDLIAENYNIDDLNLCNFEEVINRSKEISKSESKKPTRILIRFGLIRETSKLLQDIFHLKSIARRMVNCVCIFMFNPHVFDTVTLMRIRNISDSSLQLVKFDDETKLIYQEFDGFLKIHKFQKINSLNYANIPDSDLGFKVGRNSRYFIVDKLSLPPDVGEAPTRNSKSHQIDF